MTTRHTCSATFWLLAAMLIVVWPTTAIVQAAQRPAPSRNAAVIYACPMHPEVTSRRRGKCPKCGMTLKAPGKNAPAAANDRGTAQSTSLANSASSAENSSAPKVTGPANPDDRVDAATPASRYFPNLLLLTQDNRPVRFYDDLLKGKVVLINFIFTTCQGVCPPMTANLARVQNHLAGRMGREVAMISISVDPVTDTPERLKKYAEGFKAGPGWYFLTGDKKNVDWVLYKLGGYVEDKQQHSSILIIGND